MCVKLDPSLDMDCSRLLPQRIKFSGSMPNAICCLPTGRLQHVCKANNSPKNNGKRIAFLSPVTLTILCNNLVQASTVDFSNSFQS